MLDQKSVLLNLFSVVQSGFFEYKMGVYFLIYNVLIVLFSLSKAEWFFVDILQFRSFSVLTGGDIEHLFKDTCKITGIFKTTSRGDISDGLFCRS